MRQITGVTKVLPLQAGDPSAANGLDMTEFIGAMRPKKWLLTLVVTAAAADVFLWGALGDNDGSTADNVWGLHNDRRGRIIEGKITAPPVGTHHYVLDDLGMYARLCLKSAATATATLTEIYENTRSG